MSITVLHLIKGLGPGGAENLLLSQAQVTEHPDVRYLAAHLVPRKNHLVLALEDNGVKVTCLDAPDPRDPRWLGRLRSLLTSEKVDVVHGHSPLVSAQLRMLLRSIPAAQRPASVYTEHNEWGRHNKLTRRANKATIKFEDKVYAVSDAVRRTMEGGNAEVLRHGVDVESVARLRWEHPGVRDELYLEPRHIVFGTVANFRKEKAYDVMLEAAAKAMAQDPDIRFVSVGQGPLVDDVTAHRKRLGLEENFDLLGYRDDATRIMSGFDVFTLSSRHEGLPVSLMDAMALGLPVVATDVGGIREAVTDANGSMTMARLVDSGDVAGLAAAYVEAANDERWRRDAGEAALVRATDFDIRRAVGVLEQSYLDLAARR